MGFPGGSVVKNQLPMAEDMGSIPDPGRSHVAWDSQPRVPHLLSLGSRAQKPQLLKPRYPRACARQLERPLELESSRHLLQLEKAHAQKQRPSTKRKKDILKKKKQQPFQCVEHLRCDVVAIYKREAHHLFSQQMAESLFCVSVAPTLYKNDCKLVQLLF